jgi:hypothetical protein
VLLDYYISFGAGHSRVALGYIVYYGGGKGKLVYTKVDDQFLKSSKIMSTSLTISSIYTFVLDLFL